MNEHDSILDRIDPVSGQVSSFVYGHEMLLISDVSIVILPNDERGRAEVPLFIHTSKGPQLQLSEAGAQLWTSKLGEPCDVAEVDPVDLYVSAAVAQLELISAAETSLRTESRDEALTQRVLQSYMMVKGDNQAERITSQMDEHTRVSFKGTLKALDYEELVKLNMLRYGIGVALRSIGLEPQEIEEKFQKSAQGEAINSINNYTRSAARFLSTELINDDEITKHVDKVYEIDPPILEIAASAPMNVTHLFDR